MSDFLFEKLNKTKVSIPYALSMWTNEQKEGATISTASEAEILTYTELFGAVMDHFYSYAADLYHKDDLTIEDAATMIFNKYQRWKNNRLDGIRRAWAALHAPYDAIYTYEHFEDLRTDYDITDHGRKLSTATDLKVGENKQEKTVHARDEKTERATDQTTSTNTDIKTGTNTDLKSAVNTNIQEQQTNTTQTSKRPTWLEDDQTTAQEVTAPGTKTTSGDKLNNYTETSGAASANYDRTEGSAENNYIHSEGLAASNYDRTTADGTLNYDETTAGEDDNYKHTEGDVTKNYSLESGETGREIEHGAVHKYGYNGKPQENIIAELEIARLNFKEELVREWVESVSYMIQEV